MYVYVTKFEGQPHLLKIGKSVSPESRNTFLSNTHGPIVYSGHYLIGEDYSKVENYLHKKYGSQREKILGDGGSEFFSDTIYEDVCDYLDKYRIKKSKLINEEFIRAQLKVERKRYHKLISRLLGYGNCQLSTGEWYSIYTGYEDMTKITACYEMGFPPDEIHSKYILNRDTSFRKPSFTTVGRVKMAYELAKNGTEKERELKRLLVSVTKSNEGLLETT